MPYAFNPRSNKVTKAARAALAAAISLACKCYRFLTGPQCVECVGNSSEIIEDGRNFRAAMLAAMSSGLNIPMFQSLHAKSRCLPRACQLDVAHGQSAASHDSVRIRHDDPCVDVASTDARAIHALRHASLGFVTLFLRVIPRVPSLDLAAEPLIARGTEVAKAQERAAAMLTPLRIAPRLWSVPAAFSDGEQRRINSARTLICGFPILLLDEPTASVDEVNRDTVLELLDQRRASGAALVGIFPIPTLHPVARVD